MFLLDPRVPHDTVPEFPTGVCGWAANGVRLPFPPHACDRGDHSSPKTSESHYHLAIRGDPNLNLNRHRKGDLFDVDAQPCSNHTRGQRNCRFHVSDFHLHTSLSDRVPRLHDRATRASMGMLRGRLVSTGHAAPRLSTCRTSAKCTGFVGRMHHNPTGTGVDLLCRQLVSTWNDVAGRSIRSRCASAVISFERMHDDTARS